MIEDKKALLEVVRQGLESGDITRTEIKELLAHGPETVEGTKEKPASHEGRAKLVGAALYVVGAVVVCSGIAAMIGQSWNELTMPMRILLTLGLGLVFLAVGGYLKRTRKSDELLAETLLAISAVALIIGTGVTTYEIGYELTPQTAMVDIGLLGLVFAGLYLLLRSPIIAFAGFAMLFGYLQAFAALYQEEVHESITQYTVMLGGLLLAVAGIVLRARTVLGSITGALRVLGSLAVLGAGFSLMVEAGYNYSSYYDSGNSSLEALWVILLYPALLAATVYASVIARSRGLLLVASIFLTFFIIYLCGKYFTDVIGWPLSLMLAGLGIIGVAYGARKFQGSFLKRREK